MFSRYALQCIFGERFYEQVDLMGNSKLRNNRTITQWEKGLAQRVSDTGIECCTHQQRNGDFKYKTSK